MDCFLLSFSSTHDGINAKMHLRNKYPFTILPTPREIHASCGISIRIRGEDFDTVRTLLSGLGIGHEQARFHRIVVFEGKNSYEPV